MKIDQIRSSLATAAPSMVAHFDYWCRQGANGRANAAGFSDLALRHGTRPAKCWSLATAAVEAMERGDQHRAGRYVSDISAVTMDE